MSLRSPQSPGLLCEVELPSQGDLPTEFVLDSNVAKAGDSAAHALRHLGP